MNDVDSSWIDLCPLAEVPAEGGHYVIMEGRPLAVFRVPPGGQDVRVMDDTCPHAGASLSAGHLDDDMGEAGQTCIVCPWHAWPFDVDDGRCPDNPTIGVRVYPSRVRGGHVQVRASL